MIQTISLWIMPMLILCILSYATFKRAPAYEWFVEGGKEGIDIAISILPYLLGMFVSISILRESGALDAFIQLFVPMLAFFGVPAEIVPLAIVRPISGTASLAMMTEITKVYGPDSFIGRLVATMQGSTDTTLYILTVYFGAVQIKKMKYAMKVGLMADFVSVIVSIIIVKLIFM